MEGHETQPAHVRGAHWINATVVLALLGTGVAILTADHRNAARAWHIGIAIVFIANAVFYALASFARGTLRRIIPSVARSHERHGYSGEQRLAYSAVMAAGIVLAFTGTALWLGKRLPWMLAVLGGERMTLTIHVVLACALLAFIVVHVVQVLRAGLPTLTGMIAGATHPGPARTRRSFVWSAIVVASLAATFALATYTSGPTGVPVFLRWAAHGERIARVSIEPGLNSRELLR